MALAGELIERCFPSSQILPASIGSAPNTARASSVRPDPISPAKPRISPARTSFELIDTGIFAGNRYFDIFVEYTKAAPEDILIRIIAANRGPEAAPLHLLPTLWFRNTWFWGRDDRQPLLYGSPGESSSWLTIAAVHHGPGLYVLCCEEGYDLLFTNNETNMSRLFGVPVARPT